MLGYRSRESMLRDLAYSELCDWKRWWDRGGFGFRRQNKHAALAVVPYLNDGVELEELYFDANRVDVVGAYLEDLEKRRKDAK